MPIKIKHSAAPQQDYETVKILGLEIPLTHDLPFGGQVELLDLQTRFDEGEIGQFEFLMRLFCTFTKRLPKREWVRYEWLAQQRLEADEMSELVNGVKDLLDHFSTKDVDKPEVDEGKSEAPSS